MIVEFRGGVNDGLVFDTDDGGVSPSCVWQCEAFELRPVPAELEVRSWLGAREVYRLEAAGEWQVVYVLDPQASAALTSQPPHAVLQ